MVKLKLKKPKFYRLKRAIYYQTRGKRYILYDLCDLCKLPVKRLVLGTGLILLLMIWLRNMYNKYSRNSYSSMHMFEYEY